MRTIIRLTGSLTPEDLSPEVQDEFLLCSTGGSHQANDVLKDMWKW